MNSILSPDSKFIAALTRLADLIILNLVFLGTCIPVITIGPALSSLYYVVFSMGTENEKKAVKAYFQAFKANFILTLKLWLIFLIPGAAIAVDIIMLLSLPSGTVWIFIVLCLLALFELLVFGYAFPLAGIFENGIKTTLKNAVLLSIVKFPVSILIAAINAFPLFLFLYDPTAFYASLYVWVGIYFSAAAFIISKLLRSVLRPFLSHNGNTESDN